MRYNLTTKLRIKKGQEKSYPYEKTKFEKNGSFSFGFLLLFRPLKAHCKKKSGGENRPLVIIPLLALFLAHFGNIPTILVFIANQIKNA